MVGRSFEKVSGHVRCTLGVVGLRGRGEGGGVGGQGQGTFAKFGHVISLPVGPVGSGEWS